MHSSPAGPSSEDEYHIRQKGNGRDTETRPRAPHPTRTRVLFFDAEGTLWTPRPGKHARDFWAAPSREAARTVFHAEPNLPRVLERLKKTGCRLVVLSRHQERLLPQILDEFHLGTYFDAVLINGDKGDRAAHWLRQNGIPHHEAAMIGDREDLDIAPMRRVGIPAWLIDRPYNRHVDAPRLHRIEDLLETISSTPRATPPVRD